MTIFAILKYSGCINGKVAIKPLRKVLKTINNIKTLLKKII